MRSQFLRSASYVRAEPFSLMALQGAKRGGVTYTSLLLALPFRYRRNRAKKLSISTSKS